MASRNEYELDLKNSDWDDSKIIEAFDRSKERADRARGKTNLKSKNNARSSTGRVKSKFEEKLVPGMFCRARYSGDELYYEAKLRKVGRDTCTVEFLGYGDIEEVDLMDLKESLGKKARRDQMKACKDENACNMSLTCESSSEASVSHSSYVNKKRLHESQLANQSVCGHQDAGNVCPVALPAASHYPPPPQAHHPLPFLAPTIPPLLHCSSTSNNQSLSNLLMSWYMAGYYTGLHQSKKGSSCSQRCCNHSNQCCHH